MKNFFKLFTIVLVVGIALSATAFATTYYSTGSLAPNTLSNWNSNRDGSSGTAPADFITSADIFVVQGTGGGSGAPHTMIITATWTIGAGVTVQVEGGATLQSALTFSITFNATSTFQLDAGATYNHNTAVAYGSTILAGVESFATTSNFVILNSATTGPGTPTSGFGNLTVNPTGLTGSVNSSGALTNIKGNLTIIQTGGGTYEFRLTGATALTLNIGGNLEIQGGIFTLGNGAADPIVNLSGNFIMSGGRLNHIATGGTVSVNKIGTINFNRSGVQTFTKSGGTITATAGTSYRRISFVVLNGSTLDMGTNVLDCATGNNVDFTVNAGGTVRLGAPGGIVAQGTSATTGNIQTSSTSIRSFSTTGNYEYTGTAAQVTGDGLPSSVNNFTVNNSNGVTLTNPLTVNGSLAFTAGRLEGTLTKSITSGTAGIVNLMSADNYINIQSSPTPAITSVTIKSYPGVTPPNPHSLYDATLGVSRYYEITSVTGTGYVNPKFDYLSSEKGSNLTPSNAVVWESTVALPAWVSMGGTGSAYYTETTTPISESGLVGKYAIADASSALPVQLASFVGSYVGNSAKLEWSTISEVNNYGFNVQRFNGVSKIYENAGFVAGKGTTLESQTYTFVDNDSKGSVEYRLEQVDNNGLKNYFGPIFLNPNSVDNNSVPAVFALNQNYPNPFNPSTKISFSLANANYTTLKVYNIVGKEVATLFNGNAEAGKQYVANFDAKNLTSGMYFYKLQSGSNVEVKKLTLVK